jgi:hypothetical protein
MYWREMCESPNPKPFIQRRMSIRYGTVSFVITRGETWLLLATDSPPLRVLHLMQVVLEDE